MADHRQDNTQHTDPTAQRAGADPAAGPDPTAVAGSSGPSVLAPVSGPAGPLVLAPVSGPAGPLVLAPVSGPAGPPPPPPPPPPSPPPPTPPLPGSEWSGSAAPLSAPSHRPPASAVVPPNQLGLQPVWVPLASLARHRLFAALPLGPQLDAMSVAKLEARVVPWVAAMALAADVAVRRPAGSVAATLTVVATIGLLAASRCLVSKVDWVAAGLVGAAGLLLMFRASPWVTGILLAAIGGLVALLAERATSPHQRWPWLRAAASMVHNLLDVWPWLGSSWSTAARGRIERRHWLIWLRVAAVVSAVLLVIGGLLASGDAAFAWFVGSLLVWSWLGHVVVAGFMAVVASIVALSAARSTPEPAGDVFGPRLRVEALAATWAVAVVLTVWCGLQLVIARGGAAAALDEQGLTAAEYAREGFFQLVAVAAVSLTVLNLGHRLARAELRPDRAQRVPAVVIGLTLGVLIIVTFSRLAYYVDAFGVTMLRFSVATFLSWLAVMTALSVARSLGAGQGRNWLPTAAVLSLAAFAVAYGTINPEALVASTNLGRAETVDDLDTRYLAMLSSDARPTVARFDWRQLGGRPDEVTDWLCRRASGGYGPLGWSSSTSWTWRPDPAEACD